MRPTIQLGLILFLPFLLLPGSQAFLGRPHPTTTPLLLGSSLPPCPCSVQPTTCNAVRVPLPFLSVRSLSSPSSSLVVVSSSSSFASNKNNNIDHDDITNNNNDDNDTTTTTNESIDTLHQPPSDIVPDSHDELVYALGVNLARQLGDVRPLVETGHELALVAKGLLDTVVGRLSDTGQVALLSRRGAQLNQLITKRANAIRERLEQAGRDRLAELAQSNGALTLPTGVVVHVLEHGPDGPGQGKRPTQASTVKIHYHGTLADGTVFDSTTRTTSDRDGSGSGYDDDDNIGQPVQFPLAGVIPGWRDGVLKLHEGETAMIGIPPEQAYGPNGTPDGRIPGGSTLFFKIQLLEVMSAAIGGRPELLGADGRKMDTRKKTASSSSSSSSSGLLGADGKPLI